MSRSRAVFTLLLVWLGTEHVSSVHAQDYVVQQEQRLLAATDSGNYQHAERIVQEMLREADGALRNDPESRSYIFTDAASLYVDLERYELAADLARKALAEAGRAFPPNDARFAMPLNNLGNALMFLGRLREAEEAHRKALTLRRTEFGVNSDAYGDSLENLASALDLAGRYAEARQLYDQALKSRIEQHGGSDARVGRLLSNIGESLVRQGRSDEAEIYLRDALSVFAKSLPAGHPLQITPLDLLGHLCLRAGRLAEAEKHFKQALGIAESSLGSASQYATLGGGLASVYEAQHRYDEAAAIYQKRILYLRKTNASRSQIATALELLAVLRSSQDNKGEAEKLLAEAATLLGPEEATPLQQFAVHYARALNQLGQNQLDEALKQFDEALKHAERERLQLSGSTANQAEAFTRTRTAYDIAGIIALEKKDLAEAFSYFERGRARGLLDQIAASHIDPLEDLSADQKAALQGEVMAAARSVKQAEQAFDETLAKVDPKTEAGAKSLTPLRSKLASARFRLVEAHAAITNASLVYRKVMARDLHTTSLADVSAWCRKEQAILLYYVVTMAGTALVYVDPADGRSGSTELVLTEQQGKTLGVEPGALTLAKSMQIVTSGKGEGVVDLLKMAKRPPEKFERLLERLAALWKVLVPPNLQSRICDGSAKRLVIVPSGGLAYFPFETLVLDRTAGADIRYLLEACPPTVSAPSMTVLFHLNNRKAPEAFNGPASVLSLGDPQYDAPGSASASAGRGRAARKDSYLRAGGKFDPLPASGDESRAVVAAFQQHGLRVKQLLQATATEEGIRRNVAGQTIVHLACHGSASLAYGNFYGCLAVAAGPKATSDMADDGLLTVAEIYPLELRACELAILSACQTNIGPNEDGEGVWAISRAFMVAGARRVVASYWSVSDTATALLMTSYSASIAAGIANGSPDYAGSLHAAKRTLRSMKGAADPRLWAPFVLVGPN